MSRNTKRLNRWVRRNKGKRFVIAGAGGDRVVYGSPVISDAPGMRRTIQVVEFDTGNLALSVAFHTTRGKYMIPASTIPNPRRFGS